MIRHHCNLCDRAYTSQDDMQTTVIAVVDMNGREIEKTINICDCCASNIALEIPIGQ